MTVKLLKNCKLIKLNMVVKNQGAPFDSKIINDFASLVDFSITSITKPLPPYN